MKEEGSGVAKVGWREGGREKENRAGCVTKGI